MLDTPKISLECLIYESFANAFDARLQAQQHHGPEADELKALEEQLWRLFIRQAYRDAKDCPRVQAA
ncbi:MAG: hypothetical protein M1438_00560 [Deltaproteobacteria bacterium]|nr:hypothetical protein [Deltaproteobacteria bacterium]